MTLAQQIPGSQYFYLGSGISYFPLGASGAADFMKMEGNLYNPASFADTKRITADLSMGGFGGDNFLVNVRGSFPTNIGIMTGNFLALTSPSGATAGDVFGVKGTFSKAISEEWLFGAGVNLGYASGGPQTDIYASLDLGTIYRKKVDGTGIGFYDHSVGLVLRNAGKNISYAGYDAFPPFAVDLGGKVEVARKGIYRARVGSHLMVPFNPPHLFLGAGVENIFFDMVNVKLGLNLGIEDISPFSFGLDLNFDLEDTGVQFSYSLLPTRFSGQSQVVHSAGLSVAFGTYDKKPPEAVVKVENLYFSPNHDGINDRAKFAIQINDNTMVFGWKFDILDQAGRPVKSFEAQDVRKIRKMTVMKYFNRIFSRKQEVEIPKFIEWDGEDSKGNVVPDGTYTYVLTAWDENNNKTVTEKGTLVVDNVIPIVQCRADELLFSPNDDGVKDTLTFTIKSANIEPSDRVIIRIADKKGNVVYEDLREGPVGETFVWNGKNRSGAPVPDGSYRFSIAAFDRAGNKTESTVDGIIVKTEYEKISATPSLRAFSPNGDGYYDINDIRLFTSSREGLLTWELSILNESGTVVREYRGERLFPDVISFDGKDLNGKILSDGLYTVRFRLLFDSGNHPESYYKFLRIDNTPPRIVVESSILAFSPNGDGVQDTMNILHDIVAGEGDVFGAKIVNAAGATFKTLNFGTAPPKVVVWDGMGDNNTQPVEGTYTYIITGRDEVGNSTTASLGPIKVVTGFEEISIEPDEFAFSPNGDGIKEQVTFKINASSRQGIVEWKLNIIDKNQEVVRSFSNRDMGISLPTDIVWDGRNTPGTMVPDGIYTATLGILYDTGNNPISKPKDVKVDVRPPGIEVYVRDLNISPNDDGSKETMVIFQNIRGEADDLYTGEIVDFDRKVVKSFAWRGAPPVEIVWDGRDEKGTPLKEGLYTYTLRGQDAAGNRAEKTVANIKLTTTYEKVSIVASEKGISPNNDGHYDSVSFKPSVSSDKNLITWFLDIYNSQGQIVRTIKGTKTPPPTLTWDGTDNSGALLPDGDYTFVMGLIYESGNHPTSGPIAITIDTTPPEYQFVVSPKLFSPDGDGEADTMYINVDLYDRSGIATWEITLYRVWDGKIDRAAPFKRFSGSGNYRDTIRWDGYSDPVQMPAGFKPPDDITYRKVGTKWAVLVDSAISYVAELVASDRYMNTVKVQRDYMTDILVIRTPYGLKIMINSIQFEFDREDLLPQSYEILKRLIQILEKFPGYKVKIAGHTDWIGSDEYNQKLSERRAFSVYRYLVANDVDKERLSTEGRGESQPIDTNDTEQGRARNRRVEFYLTK